MWVENITDKGPVFEIWKINSLRPVITYLRPFPKHKGISVMKSFIYKQVSWLEESMSLSDADESGEEEELNEEKSILTMM